MVILRIGEDRLSKRIGVGSLLFFDRNDAGHHDPTLTAGRLAAACSAVQRPMPACAAESLRRKEWRVAAQRRTREKRIVPSDGSLIGLLLNGIFASPE